MWLQGQLALLNCFSLPHLAKQYCSMMLASLLLGCLNCIVCGNLIELIQSVKKTSFLHIKACQ